MKPILPCKPFPLSLGKPPVPFEVERNFNNHPVSITLNDVKYWIRDGTVTVSLKDSIDLRLSQIPVDLHLSFAGDKGKSFQVFSITDCYPDEALVRMSWDVANEPRNTALRIHLLLYFVDRDAPELGEDYGEWPIVLRTTLKGKTIAELVVAADQWLAKKRDEFPE